MPSLNKVTLIGHLGRDPEVRMTQSGSKVCNLNLATSEKYKDKETTEWHRLIAFGPIAEIAEKYLKKGSSVYIEGKLQTRKWQDKDGVDKYTTEIIVNQLLMLGGKSETPSSNVIEESQSIPF